MKRRWFHGIVFWLVISFLLVGCGDNPEKTSSSKEIDTSLERSTNVIAVTTNPEDQKKADLENAQYLSNAVYMLLADEEIYDETKKGLDGKIIIWANDGQPFEDGGAGFNKLLLQLNADPVLAGSSPKLQYKENLIGSGNFVPSGWAISFENGKICIYVTRGDLKKITKDYTDKVQIYPDTDRNYLPSDNSDPYREDKDKDISSASEIKTAATAALANEKAYDEVMYRLQDGKIVAWAKEGEAFEGDGCDAFVKELNDYFRFKPDGVPTLHYKESIFGGKEFVPAGWAIAFKDSRPVVYITDGTITKDTVDTAGKVQIQPEVDWHYR